MDVIANTTKSNPDSNISTPSSSNDSMITIPYKEEDSYVTEFEKDGQPQDKISKSSLFCSYKIGF